jgi:choline dehydrogenase-like flavoprotein
VSEQRYDVIIIGTGAGGGTLAHRLAATGKKVLLLERGRFLPREKANWSTVEVFHKDRYHTDEVWLDKKGKEFRPGTGYWVGGNTKVFGAAVLRLRERDFGEVKHKDGLSPAWPLAYRDFEPYYTRAESLYQVHGKRGVDPTEPAMSGEYPFPPVSHEPRILELEAALRGKGLNPFYLPLAVRLDEQDQVSSACIRCETCDGFPCVLDAKGDSDITCVRPAVRSGAVQLVTEAKVLRLHTSASGREVTGVEVDVKGERYDLKADVVVVACGAINSAVLLLRSANDRHPNGLANGSDQVGRNFMKHNNGAITGITRTPNPTVFQKTLALNDFYWGEEGYEFPMGHVQLLGKVNKEMMEGDAPFFAPGIALDVMAAHSIDWWLTGEDLPDPENRVRVQGDAGEQVVLEYTDNNTEAFARLLKRWQKTLKEIDSGDDFLPNGVYFKKQIPIQAVGHQVGTCRFGTDPKTSVLDLNCRAHEVDNLYVVDGSFFPSSAAVNPSLTIMANALRVGDHLAQRLK